MWINFVLLAQFEVLNKLGTQDYEIISYKIMNKCFKCQYFHYIDQMDLQQIVVLLTSIHIGEIGF